MILFQLKKVVMTMVVSYGDGNDVAIIPMGVVVLLAILTNHLFMVVRALPMRPLERQIIFDYKQVLRQEREAIQTMFMTHVGIPQGPTDSIFFREENVASIKQSSLKVFVRPACSYLPLLLTKLKNPLRTYVLTFTTEGYHRRNHESPPNRLSDLDDQHDKQGLQPRSHPQLLELDVPLGW